MPQERKRFDARPDRLDLSDRRYAPPLRSLPGRYPSLAFIEGHLDDYIRNFILDQGEEGACTGFGLACLVNYLFWRRAIDAHRAECGDEPWVRTEPARRVSPRMLYQLARVYDEWAGEDYEGSSCRGAMRGWFHHGVCDETLWPFFGRGGDDAVASAGGRPQPMVGSRAFVRPGEGWLADAATRPLGAYYRVDRNSIVDLQAALVEVGAMLVSANVHAGWDAVPPTPALPLPIIQPRPKALGVHAFALVGYDDTGFLVQNSWGRSWGYNGFAVLTYADWVRHGLDAWVGVLGAPMKSLAPESESRARAARGSSSTRSLVQFGSPPASSGLAGKRLSTSAAYQHTLVLGAGGRLVNRFVDAQDARMAGHDVVVRHTLDCVPRNRKLRVLLFATGGLDGEAATVRRIAHLTPWFQENLIHPIFLTWQRGLIAPLEQVLGSRGDMTAGAHTLGVSAEAVDRFMEVEANTLLARAIWMQRKQDSQAAAEHAERAGGLVTLVDLLHELEGVRKDLELHLASHSSGVLLHGHLLKLLAEAGMSVQSASFLVPACSFDFALDYLAGVPAEILDPWNMHFDVLSTQAERKDPVGSYGQSLLMLMSRALEEMHKTPILGLAQAWQASRSADAKFWNRAPTTREQLARWREHAASALDDQPVGYELKVPPVGEAAARSASQTAHAVFDRRGDVFRQLVYRIRRRDPKGRVSGWLAPTD